jgi:hypothetical protein
VHKPNHISMEFFLRMAELPISKNDGKVRFVFLESIQLLDSGLYLLCLSISAWQYRERTSAHLPERLWCQTAPVLLSLASSCERCLYTLKQMLWFQHRILTLTYPKLQLFPSGYGFQFRGDTHLGTAGYAYAMCSHYESVLSNTVVALLPKESEG